MGKAVALLGESNSCLTCLAGDILVAVQHDLRGERRMAAYFDGDVSPLGVQNVKGIVVDIGHRLLFLEAHSTAKCNGEIFGVEENLTRSSVAGYLSGTRVEFVLDPLDIGIRHNREIGTFWEVLSK